MCYANQIDIKISIKIMQAKPRKLKFDSILIFPAKVIKQTLEMKKIKQKQHSQHLSTTFFLGIKILSLLCSTSLSLSLKVNFEENSNIEYSMEFAEGSSN